MSAGYFLRWLFPLLWELLPLLGAAVRLDLPPEPDRRLCMRSRERGETLSSDSSTLSSSSCMMDALMPLDSIVGVEVAGGDVALLGAELSYLQQYSTHAQSVSHRLHGVRPC